jgi:chromosome segregation ATPase
MSRKQAEQQPAESVVQSLLAETRSLKVALARARMELEDAKGQSSGPDPKLGELQGELRRLRTQLDDARAEANVLRTERDELQAGIERALAQLETPE